eukprot:8077199-Lingulodinium_polyedra.AAC.1
MHGVVREYNVHAQADGGESVEPHAESGMLTDAELRAELCRREALLQVAPTPAVRPEGHSPSPGGAASK